MVEEAGSESKTGRGARVPCREWTDSSRGVWEPEGGAGPVINEAARI